MAGLGSLALLVAAQVTPPVAGPAALDLGVRRPDCAGLAGVAGVVNTSDRPVVVERVRLEGAPGLTLDPAPAVPAVVGAGQRWPIGLRPQAPDEGDLAGRLVIETSRGPVVTRLTGTFADVLEDRHRQRPGPRADILIAIDDAPSMRARRGAVLTNIERFGRFLLAVGVDARVAVTTISGPDAGRLRTAPGAPTPPLPLRDDLDLARLVALADAPTAAAAGRRGFDSVLRALDASPAFPRPDTPLTVLFVSDADDDSAISAPAFTDALRRRQGFRFRNLVTVFSVVGDARGGCATDAGRAEPGTRYVFAAFHTGGTFDSICDPYWSRGLEGGGLASGRLYRSFGFKSRFYLRARPSAPAEVFVNGALLPARSPAGTLNWTYDEGSGSVNFSPFATPAPGAEIRVRYPPGCPIARPASDF